MQYIYLTLKVKKHFIFFYNFELIKNNCLKKDTI
jgi:hypothetical protein